MKRCFPHLRSSKERSNQRATDEKVSAEGAVRDSRRQTRRKYSAQQPIWIGLAGMVCRIAPANPASSGTVSQKQSVSRSCRLPLHTRNSCPVSWLGTSLTARLFHLGIERVSHLQAIRPHHQSRVRVGQSGGYVQAPDETGQRAVANRFQSVQSRRLGRLLTVGAS